MRNPLRWLSALTLAFLLGGLLLSPVSAQDDDDSFDFSQLPGVQRGITRLYFVDFSAMYSSMSTPDAATPALPDLAGISAAIFQFDNGDNSKAGFDTLYGYAKESADAALTEDADGGTPVVAPTINETDVDDLGDNAKAVSIVETVDGSEEYSVLLVVQDGEEIYFVAGYGATDSLDTIKGFVQEMIDRDPGDGDGTFNEDGTSTGGLWDLFARSDDPIPGGLIVGGDQIIYPEGTPEAGS